MELKPEVWNPHERFRKGFAHTLEAIIASALILSTVTVVMPEIRPGSGNGVVQERTFKTLEAADRAGEMDNPSVEKVENRIRDQIPLGYNFSARVDRLKNNTGKVDAPAEISLDIGRNGKLLLQVEEASGLNASYDGTKLLKEVENSKFSEFNTGNASGTLEFDGSGTVIYQAQWQNTLGENVEQNNVFSANYLYFGEKLNEIRVLLWQQ